jgi:hypothetical protein
MRKSVELGLEYLLSFFFSAVFLPLICGIGSQMMLITTDYSFLLVNIIIYALNVTIMKHMIKFMIISRSASDFVGNLFEFTQLTVALYGYFMS